jgi:hypothetical protein
MVALEILTAGEEKCPCATSRIWSKAPRSMTLSSTSRRVTRQWVFYVCRWWTTCWLYTAWKGPHRITTESTDQTESKSWTGFLRKWNRLDLSGFHLSDLWGMDGIRLNWLLFSCQDGGFDLRYSTQRTWHRSKPHLAMSLDKAPRISLILQIRSFFVDSIIFLCRLNPYQIPKFIQVLELASRANVKIQ